MKQYITNIFCFGVWSLVSDQPVKRILFKTLNSIIKNVLRTAFPGFHLNIWGGGNACLACDEENFVLFVGPKNSELEID